MSRRRKKNPLLGRIILVSVAAHVVALPIAAHYGAFEKIRQQFGDAKVVMVTVANTDKEPPTQKAQKKATKSQQTAKKGGPATHRPAGPKSNLNLPKVVTSSEPAGAEGAPAVESGTGTAGAVPTLKKEPEAGPGGGSGPNSPVAQPKNETPPAEKKEPVVEKKEPPPAPPKKPAVFAAAEPTYSPAPVIPDELREDALDKAFVVEFTVDPGGHPADIKVVQSTGIDELDQVALKTARQWRFRPATKDGEPVQGKVRLRIEFKVD